MRKLLLLLFLLPIIFSCKKNLTPEQKAQQLVKLYLDSSLNDPKSYESVKFGKLDTLQTSPADQPQYKKLTVSYDNCISADSSLKEIISLTTDKSSLLLYRNQRKRVLDTAISILHQKNKFLDFYKPKTIGWVLYHSYRGKNAIGALVLNQSAFYLNKQLSKVDSSQTLK